MTTADYEPWADVALELAETFEADPVDDHAPYWLTTSRQGCSWMCSCGAEGEGTGNPTVGWAEHVAELVKEQAQTVEKTE